jgi:zinc-binding in reverse transcriptase
LVRKNKILTKANLLRRGWQGSPQCVFCQSEETTDHLFVQCTFIQVIWQWISQFNNFEFVGTSMEDLWMLDALILFKNQYLVEMIRGLCYGQYG